jgi:hypothetical protein
MYPLCDINWERNSKESVVDCFDSMNVLRLFNVWVFFLYCVDVFVKVWMFL